ncbi:hypothetical protein V9T40_004107 [Parthenolecanium corni]|uniref:Ig-like domain-containing protein n=1 Tax=Parthenolecanium corni TaxID=536013 RepID=A0AAN9TID2_9HEMI
MDPRQNITAGLRLTEIFIPKHIDLKEKAQLSCKFEITQGKLYSVKWYKDENEFFRYMPDSSPEIHTFPVDGVHLDISRSNKTTVTLYNLSFNSSGNYRCEVSKEGPNFETVVRNGDMRVMGNPRQPEATRGNPRQPKATRGNPRQSEATRGNLRQPEAIRGNPRQSEATRGNPRQPEAIRGNPRQPEATRGNPRQPEATQGNPRQPEAIRGNPRQPEAIRGNPRQSEAAQGNPRHSEALVQISTLLVWSYSRVQKKCTRRMTE